MNNLKAKLKKQGGFTLIEMLIVVAIIAILIAIAIPMVNNALEAAREATDEANMRAAIGIATADYMMGTDDVGGVLDSTNREAYYHIDANKQGELKTTAPTKGYGKGLAGIGADNVSHEGEWIKITVGTDGKISGAWTNS